MGWCGGLKGQVDDWCGTYHGFDGKYDDQQPEATSIPTPIPVPVPVPVPVPTPTPTVTIITPKKNWAGYEYSADGRCGPQFNNTACPNQQCCSSVGWCGGVKGQSDAWCGTLHGFDGKYDDQQPEAPYTIGSDAFIFDPSVLKPGYVYYQNGMWTLPATGNGAVVFKVNASGDFYIQFAPTAITHSIDDANAYGIVVGGETASNRTFIIYNGLDTRNTTGQFIPTPINWNTETYAWVMVQDNNKVSFGLGQVVGQNSQIMWVIDSTKIANPPVQYIGFGGYTAKTTVTEIAVKSATPIKIVSTIGTIRPMPIMPIVAVTEPEFTTAIVPLETTDISMSSCYNNDSFNASKLIDGAHDTFAYTFNGPEEWLEITLKKEIPIVKLIMTNRQDCCGDRIVGAVLTFTNATGTNTYTKTISTEAKSYEIIPPTGTMAKVIHLAQFNQYINLGEIVIYSTADVLRSYPQKDNWRCLESTYYTGPVTKNSAGDVQCMSTDATNCVGASSLADCNNKLNLAPRNIKPLACGTTHKSIYGITGYENAGHWCAMDKDKL